MIYLISHSVTQSAKRFPNRNAFRCAGKSLTYAQLEQQMNQLANTLQQLGIQKGDRVGIYLNRCIESAVAIYGILQAGAVYVPIDPKAPIDRSRFLIEDCGIDVLISQPSQKRNLKQIIQPDTRLKTIIGLEGDWSVDTINWEQVFKASENFERPFRMLEKDLAYIIYTSGSTGQPKGIMHSHYSGLSYARLTADLYDLSENDVIGNHAPTHFDISTMGYLTGPMVGACTVIVNDAQTIFPASLGQLIDKEAITLWYSVPLALIQLLQNGVLYEKKFPELRWVLYGGEAFPAKYLRELMQLWPQTKFSNVYGPAEVNQCTYYQIPAPPGLEETIPIGTVWENTDYLILNENGEETKDNEIGELLIRSATQMLGYWQNPELTKKSLHSIESNTGQLLHFYKTGDLVKRNVNGLLEFLGRKDFQVKVRGYRVELEAVETCLLTHEAVSEAAVYAVRISEEAQQIEAAVILKSNNAITTTETLLNYLKTKLPFYAVPAQMHVMEDFPRTTSGKIKRSAIAANRQPQNN
ncbi:MAG: amino acid adenylation domain-containing protein [Saprospiraceae bacterium]